MFSFFFVMDLKMTTFSQAQHGPKKDKIFEGRSTSTRAGKVFPKDFKSTINVLLLKPLDQVIYYRVV